MLLIITFFQVEGPPGLPGPAVGNNHQVFVVTSHVCRYKRCSVPVNLILLVSGSSWRSGSRRTEGL